MAAALRAAAAVSGTFESPVFELEGCLDRHAGAECIALARQCPDLVRALDAGGLEAGLPSLGDEPAYATLETLHRLLRAARPDGASPAAAMDYASLDAILDEVHRPVEAPAPGVWERFIRWLDEVLAGSGEAAYLEPLKRLIAWLDETVPVRAMLQLLFAGLLISLVIVAGGLLVQQLVATRGRPRLPWADRGRGSTPGAAPAPDALPALADIRRLPPARQPAAVLNWCIEVLVRRNVLPARRSRTNRELLRCLDNETTAQRAFARLLDTAEPSIYGGRAADAERLERLYEHAAAVADGQQR
jgi:hypothetical protein